MNGLAFVIIGVIGFFAAIIALFGIDVLPVMV